MRRTVQSFKREGFLHDQSVTDDAQNYQMHFLSEVSQLWRALPWEDRVQDAVTRLLDTPNIEVHLDQVCSSLTHHLNLPRCIRSCPGSQAERWPPPVIHAGSLSPAWLSVYGRATRRDYADVSEARARRPRHCLPPRQWLLRHQ